MRKLFSLFAALTLSVGLWAEPVSYRYPTYIDDDVTKGIDMWIDYLVDDAIPITSSSTTWGAVGQETWFVVSENVTISQRVTCNGDVRLILANDVTLNALQGITVSGSSSSLTIYAQTEDIARMGQLIADATGKGDAAGIGGGEFGDNGSNITINGGIVTATGGDSGAGIGSSYWGSGSNITINGGIITTAGGEYGAGIGGGSYGGGSNITINGGEVTATGKGDAAGIGGGGGGSGSNITINGGEVTATGGEMAAGIGGGSYGGGSYITINGGIVTATGGTGYFGAGAGIGGGAEGVCSDFYISDAYVLKAGANADNTEVIAHSSAQDLGSTLTQQYVKIEGLATPYTRSMTVDNWATVCLPYAATSFEGADFYKVNYYDASNPSDLKLYIEPVDNLVAGMPYIFQATAETVIIYHSATTPMAYGEVGYEGRGLYGSFARKTIAYDGAYAYAAIAGGAVNVVEEGYNITIPACRAYLDMNEVPTSVQPHNAPLRCMGAPRGQATDLETIDNGASEHSDKCTMHNGKFLRNGQFIIVREGKMFNAQGMEVK